MVFSISQKNREKKALTKNIIFLRNQDWAYRDIATKLKVPLHVVFKICNALVKEGKLEKKHCHNSSFQPVCKKLDHPKIQAIIQGVRDRVSYAQIGREIGCERESIRQLADQLEAEHGPKIFLHRDPSKRLWKVSEGSEKTNIEKAVIRLLCKDGQVPFYLARGKEKMYLFDQSCIKALKKHPRITRRYACNVCGSFFYSPGAGQPHKTCGKQCKKEQDKKARLSSKSKAKNGKA